jgi:hypothetical protein
VRILVLLREEKSLCCEADVVERTWEEGGGGVGVEVGVEAELALALGLLGAGVDREERRRSGKGASMATCVLASGRRFIYGERSQSCSSSGRWLVPTGLACRSWLRDQGALTRPLPVSLLLLYPLSETLISSSAISLISNTPSLSVPPYRISYQFVHKLWMNPRYLATNYNDQFLRFFDHMTIRRSNYPA